MNIDLRSQVSRLQQQVREIQQVVKQQSSDSRIRKRDKNMPMTAEQSDTNPYSRLMALKRMGVVDSYEDIRKFGVAVVGCGGIGALVAEQLARCGIGKLILVDKENVRMCNMGRMFFRPEQTGLTKTQAARHSLVDINPDVQIETHNYDITLRENLEHFKDRLKKGGVQSDLVACVVAAVDNAEARLAINKACTELDVMWVDVSISDDGVSASMNLYDSNAQKFDTTRAGPAKRPDASCPAVLPSTECIAAGLASEAVVKYILGFGDVAFGVSYKAMKTDLVKSK